MAEQNQPEVSFLLHVMVTGYKQISPTEISYDGLLSEHEGDDKRLPLFQNQEEVWAYTNKYGKPKQSNITNIPISIPSHLKMLLEKAQKRFGITHVVFEPVGRRYQFPIATFLEQLDDPDGAVAESSDTEIPADLLKLIKRLLPKPKLFFPLYSVAGQSSETEPQPEDYLAIPTNVGKMLLLFDSPIDGSVFTEGFKSEFPDPYQWVTIESPQSLCQLLEQLHTRGIEWLAFDPLGIQQKVRLDDMLEVLRKL